MSPTPPSHQAEWLVERERQNLPPLTAAEIRILDDTTRARIRAADEDVLRHRASEVMQPMDPGSVNEHMEFANPNFWDQAHPPRRTTEDPLRRTRRNTERTRRREEEMQFRMMEAARNHTSLEEGVSELLQRPGLQLPPSGSRLRRAVPPTQSEKRKDPSAYKAGSSRSNRKVDI